VTCLRRDGFQTAYEGRARGRRGAAAAEGYQCFRILSMDESTGDPSFDFAAGRTHVTVTPTSGLERVDGEWFNRLRGFAS